VYEWVASGDGQQWQLMTDHCVVLCVCVIGHASVDVGLMGALSRHNHQLCVGHLSLMITIHRRMWIVASYVGDWQWVGWLLA